MPEVRARPPIDRPDAHRAFPRRQARDEQDADRITPAPLTASKDRRRQRFCLASGPVKRIIMSQRMHGFAQRGLHSSALPRASTPTCASSSTEPPHRRVAWVDPASCGVDRGGRTGPPRREIADACCVLKPCDLFACSLFTVYVREGWWGVKSGNTARPTRVGAADSKRWSQLPCHYIHVQLRNGTPVVRATVCLAVLATP